MTIYTVLDKEDFVKGVFNNFKMALEFSAKHHYFSIEKKTVINNYKISNTPINYMFQFNYDSNSVWGGQSCNFYAYDTEYPEEVTYNAYNIIVKMKSESEDDFLLAYEKAEKTRQKIFLEK